ncbi:MAG: hypothetical protein AAF927_14165 [Bacteroidota bacterium]
MRSTIPLFSLLVCISLFACDAANLKSKIVDLSNLSSREGMVDIPLSIVRTQELEQYYEYELKALNQKDTLGLIIRLKKGITAGFVNGEPKNIFLSDAIEFISLGEQSDNLLQFMAQKYGFGSEGLKMPETHLFTAANLNQTDVNYDSGDSRFKIFLETEEDYAELFVNFSFGADWVWLNEKDIEYREPLIKLLGTE